jgi:signal peptide peptidase SppA
MATKYRRLIALATSEVWALRQEKMEVIAAILTERRQGARLTQEEIAVRLDPYRDGAYDDDFARPSRSERKPYAIDRGVALLSLEGVLMPKASYFDQISGATSLATFQARLAAAIADDSVKAIFIEIDSPGGMVLGVSEAEKAVRLAAKQKPVHGWVRGLCCSGAYWIASACTKIHAPLTTQTGSIGVYRMHVDQSGFDEEMGEKYTYIFAGDRKVDGNAHQALQGKAKAAWQASVDEAYGLFTSTVMRNRGLSGAVGEATGNGESFYGETAKRMGLVDTHMSRAEVIDQLAGKADQQPIGLMAAGGVFNAENAETQRKVVVDAESLSAARIIIACASGTQIHERPAEAARHSDAAASIQNIRGGEARGSALPAAEEGKAAAAASLEGTKMKKELKALLYAAGVIKGLDDDEALCWERLESYAFAKGVSFSRDKQDEICAYFTKLARGGALGSTESNAATTASGAEKQEAKASDIARLDRERCDELRARAALLADSGFVVSAESLKEAMDKEWSVKDAVDVWTRKAPAAQREQKLTLPNVTQTELQVASPLVSEAISVLFGSVQPDECKIPQAAYLAQKGSLRVAYNVCDRAGLRTDMMTDEDVAKNFLRLSAGPLGEQTSFVLSRDLQKATAFRSTGERADSQLPYYGPGSHPNLFANPASRVLVDNLKVAPTTYRLWGNRMADTNTLGIQEGVGYSGYGELPREIDGLPKPQSPQASKRLFWIEPEPFSDKIGLTWLMVVNNLLMDFAMMLAQKQIAADRTVNRAMIELLTSNPTLVVDNKAVYHADHFNDITSGGVPSVAQLKLHEQAYAQQVDCIDGQTEISVQLKYLLHPDSIRTEVKQLIDYMKVQTNATVDPTKLGIWQSMVGIEDAMLRSYSDQVWYTLAAPGQVPCFNYRFLSGYGEGGRTTMWYDTETETQWWKIKTVFGVAAGRYEGTTRDAGG